MSRLGHDDPFGSLALLPDGVVVPELTPALWDKRFNVDAALPWVLALVRASGLPEWWEANIAQEKKRANPNTRDGRTRGVSVDAVLVAWVMLKITGRSLLDSEVANFLLHTLNDAQREPLGVPLVLADPTRPRTPGERHRLDKEAVAARITRLNERMIDLVNPSEFDQPRDRKKIDKELLRRDITPEQRLEAQQRLDWVVSRLTTMPLKAMPRRLRRQWTGDAAVDGTHIRLASRGNTQRSNAWDIDGGQYVRVKATSDRHAPKTKGGKGAVVTQIVKREFSLDLALVVACDATPGDRQYFPTLPLGFAAHKPSTDNIGNARRVFDVLAAAQISTRYLASDRLYPHEGGGAWHTYLGAHGWAPVFDYRVDNLGRQGIAKGGALLVEGQFHCPMTPDTAIDATADLRAGRIDHDTYKARLAQRALYRLHTKEGADANGTVRLSCPASGPAPKVRCPKRPDSMKPHVIQQPDKTNGDTRTLVQLLPTRLADVAEAEALAAGKKPKEAAALRAAAQAPNACDPKVCCGSSISIRRETLARYRQPLVFGGPNHAAVYRAARNAQEGLHGFAKDDAHEAIGNPGLRRRRGLAAQSLYAAIGLAAAAIRKIVSFLQNAKQDDQGRWFVPRKDRLGSDELALGEGGGYQDDDGWVLSDHEPPDD